MVSRLLFLAALLVLLTSSSLAQDIYKWKDEKGKWHFSNFPPSGREVERLKVRRTAPKLPPGKSPQSGPEEPQDDSKPQQFVIPFTRDGNAIIVQALVNGRGTVEFMLDTGASLTIIPLAQAQKLGIDPKRGDLFPITGVGGVVLVPVVEIESIKVGGAEARNLQVAIHGFKGRGLLGMDFLSNFRVDINNAQNQLELTSQPGDHEGYALEWWQRKFRSYYMIRREVENFRTWTRSPLHWKVANRVIRALDKRIADLEIRASRAGVPRKFRK